MTNTPSKHVPIEPVAKAVVETKKATKEIKSVAEELALVHTVLKKKLDDAADDVAAAVTRTGQAEKQLEKAATKLEEVNKALDDEVQAAHARAAPR